ncbi:MAG: tRNA lysidine(34) synthetase TilS [Acidimicrobiales bacterium]|nr:tRNA lysidine(34) synthetase TilS [Acidimicrobiales bacterium]
MPEPASLVADLAEWQPRCTFDTSGALITCAVSGGADSLALLALAAATGAPVHAVHVDHSQRAGGDTEAAIVEAAADSVGATFTSETVAVEGPHNLEARLRSARYAVLGPSACTGHTADDQAETVLINLMRGAGIRGLGAMQPGPRRPILALRRSDTERICECLGWEPVVDPTNTEPTFVRNRVRLELMPLLSDIAGRDVGPILARSADHHRHAAAALDAAASALDPTSAVDIANAPQAVAATALQEWIRRELDSDYPIDTESVERVLSVARGENVAAEVNGGHRVQRSQQRLSVVHRPPNT